MDMARLDETLSALTARNVAKNKGHLFVLESDKVAQDTSLNGHIGLSVVVHHLDNFFVVVVFYLRFLICVRGLYDWY